MSRFSSATVHVATHSPFLPISTFPTCTSDIQAHCPLQVLLGPILVVSINPSQIDKMTSFYYLLIYDGSHSLQNFDLWIDSFKLMLDLSIRASFVGSNSVLSAEFL